MGKFDNYKFRASAIGKIMTEGRSKGDLLGETCKAYLLECYISEVYGRKKDFKNKYIEKGLAVEEDSLTLYSRCTKKVYFKNQEHLKNDFVCGTPDIIDDDIIDIKSSWDIFTYFSVFHRPLNKDYIYQLQTYMALTGKKNSKLVYCLVNTPESLISDAKWKLAREMGVLDNAAHPEYIKACAQIDKEMVFDDIPMKDRYIEFGIPYDQNVMQTVYDRIVICRDFLNKLYETKTSL